MEPLVTAVITTYRRNRELLKRSIDSVLNQTYKNIEVLVIDDNGLNSEYRKTVKSLITENYDNKEIKLIQHKDNQGVQRARNNGIKNAKGEFIAFLDDDDEWLTHKIEKQIKFFNEDRTNNLALVYGWYRQVYIDNKNQFITKVNRTPEYNGENSFIELLRRNYIGSTSVPLLRKESVIEVGGFDETLPASQDYDLWLRLTKKYQVKCVNEVLINYYFHKGERISSNFSKKEIATKKILNKYEKYIKEDKVAYGNKMYNLGKNLVEQNQFSNGRSYFKKSIRIYPKGKYKLLSILQYIKSFWLESKKV